MPLFLGKQENEHHRPKDLFDILEKKINLRFIEDLDDLDDVLIIYGNTKFLTPRQETKLLNFVRSGGGLVGIHSASACFQNSQAYEKLLGGRFHHHGEGVFQPEILQPQHPTMKIDNYTSWDETFRHRNIRKDIDVLMTQDGHPWTWTRHEGGRVFYTASGHDERTWARPGFQQMIVNAVHWTRNKLLL